MAKLLNVSRQWRATSLTCLLRHALPAWGSGRTGIGALPCSGVEHARANCHDTSCCSIPGVIIQACCCILHTLGCPFQVIPKHQLHSGHNFSVSAVCFSQDGQFIATASR